MFSVNKKTSKQLATGAIPVALAVAFSIRQNIVFLLTVILSLFIIVGTVPLFKRRENLWMFVFVGLAGLPVNAVFSYNIVKDWLVDTSFSFTNFLFVITLCCIFFSIEEIVLGVITRIIWPKQYRLAL